MEMEVTADTEIRRLASGHVCNLVHILEYDKDWMKLMSEIRSNCFDFSDTQRKYTTKDMRLIEEAGVTEKRACSEIFLEEWGTSGRKRPTVQLLLDYLQKAKLWRAATHVAENMLKVDIVLNGFDKVSEDELTNTQADFYPSIYGDETIPVGENYIASHVNERSVIHDDRVKKIPYELLKRATNNFHEKLKVGCGSFGSVYSGKLNGDDVAIKKLNENALEHFEQELIILVAGVEHENLLPPLAVSDENVLCLVYKFMPNGSLEDRLALKDSHLHPLSWQKRISVALDIAEGLKFLHELPRPVVHRDIKSSNILLDENDVAKIGDFGLVKVKNNRFTSLTSTYQGTDAYMAPEALHGQISLKIDVFSFGMIMLELLTGRPIIDESKTHLMYFLDEEMENGKSVDEFVDKSAGEWNINAADQLNKLAWECLEKKLKQRPNIQKVNFTLSELYQSIE